MAEGCGFRLLPLHPDLRLHTADPAVNPIALKGTGRAHRCHGSSKLSRRLTPAGLVNGRASTLVNHAEQKAALKSKAKPLAREVSQGRCQDAREALLLRFGRGLFVSRLCTGGGDTIGDDQWNECRSYVNCLAPPGLRLSRILKIVRSTLHFHAGPKRECASEREDQIQDQLISPTKTTQTDTDKRGTLIPRLQEEIKAPRRRSQNDNGDDWSRQYRPEAKHVVDISEKELARCKRQSDWASYGPERRKGRHLGVPAIGRTVGTHGICFLVKSEEGPSPQATFGEGDQ